MTTVHLPNQAYRRLAIILALTRKWSIVVADVKTAFLHAPIASTVYVQVPYMAGTPPLKGVYKLKKALYGLKDSPRVFALYLKNLLEERGWMEMSSGFFLHANNAVLVVYVDDLLYAGADDVLLREISSAIELEIERTDETTFLGAHMKIHKRQVTLDLSDYVRDKLTNPPTTVPSALGALGWVAQLHPETAAAFSMLSRESDLSRILNAIREAEKCPPVMLQPLSSYQVMLYSDASFNIDNHTAQLGWILVWGDNPLSWRSQRAKRLIRSVAQAELYAALDAVQHNLILLEHLRLLGATAVVLYIDNSAVVNQLTKDIQPDPLVQHTVGFLTQMLREHCITVEYVPTRMQRANPLTKLLPMTVANAEIAQRQNNDNFARICAALVAEDC